MRLGIGDLKTAKERSFARDAVVGQDAYSDQSNFIPEAHSFATEPLSFFQDATLSAI